jgi:hypothetical protein
MTALPVLAALALLQTASPQKVEMVSVTGCIAPGAADSWMLTNATDPVVDQRSPAAAPGRGTTSTPQTASAPPGPLSGKNRYRLIGVLELGVPGHNGHTVTIKGLLVPGAEKKINVTSVKMVSQTCGSSKH